MSSLRLALALPLALIGIAGCSGDPVGSQTTTTTSGDDDLPDLEVTIAAAPTSAIAGSTVDVTFRVHNTGSQSATFTLDCRAYDPTGSDFEVVIDTITLAPGADMTPTFSYTADRGSGDYTATFIADPESAIDEVDEDDNQDSAVTSVVVTKPG